MSEPAARLGKKHLGDRSLSYLVRHAHRAFVRSLGIKLEPYGINVAEWAVLRMLWQEEGITQVELAGRMGVQKASLTSVLTALEAKGCIEKLRVVGDRRKWTLRLTQKGHDLEDVLLPYGIENNDIALVGVNPRDAETARKVLEAMIRNLE